MDFSRFERKKLLPQDYEELLTYFKKRYTHTVENILTSAYMWSPYYRTEYLQDENALIWLIRIEDRFATQTPTCASDKLKEYFQITQAYFNEVLGEKLVMYLNDKEAVECFDLDPEKYQITADRQYYDYVYDAGKMRTYSGRAYHKKKNHVNAFLKNYAERFEYRDLNCGCHHDEIMDFLNHWEEQRGIEDEYNRVDYELKGIDYILSSCQYLSYRMGGIYIDKKLEAFSLGTYSKAEKTAYIHVEKANPDIRGLYPFISQQFLIHAFPDAELVNREDDMGREGLRRSKLSYNPIRLVEKYEIRQR